jgi:hypothetical protein
LSMNLTVWLGEDSTASHGFRMEPKVRMGLQRDNGQKIPI